MKGHSLPVALLLIALLAVSALVFAGCQDLTGSPGPDTTATTLTTTTVATVASTLPPVTLPPTTEPAVLTTKRVEENNDKLKYVGPWTFTGGADDSGGSCIYTDSPGAAVTVKFSGVSISLVTRLGLAVGEITVTVDSGTPFTIDCYSPTPEYKQILAIADPLDDGVHIVRLECAGTCNPASGGVGIYIDAFAITGKVLSL